MIVKSSWKVLNIGDFHGIWSKRYKFFPRAVLFQQAKSNFLNYNHFFSKFTKNAPHLLHLQLPVYFRQKTYKSPKNNNFTTDNSILNLNAPQNETRRAPTNYNDINANGSNNTDDDLMDITDCIGYVKQWIIRAQRMQGKMTKILIIMTMIFFIGIRWVHFTF